MQHHQAPQGLGQDRYIGRLRSRAERGREVEEIPVIGVAIASEIEPFGNAMARSEFGRFYTDDREQQEIARSLARARKKHNGVGAEAPEKQEAEKKPLKKVQLWRPPSIRERRGELATARARLMAASIPKEQEKEE
jgi:hypothetical protein